LGLYIACGIVGGGLMLLSAFGGVFGHHDVGADGGAGVDGGSHSLEKSFDKGGGLWIPFFSVRFWTHFVGGFGVLGTVLNLTGYGAEPLAGLVSAGVGLGLGLGAAWVYRLLQKEQKDANTKSDDFLGVAGTLSVAARGNDPGKVRVTVRGDIIDLLALSDSGQDLSAGEEVVIVGIEGDKARVLRKGDILS
jgi:membrane protein implicated in regulation of membrane protease activity